MAKRMTLRRSLTLASCLFLAWSSVSLFGQASRKSQSLSFPSPTKSTDNAAKPNSKSLEIKYRGGLLSIRSQNATLGEVLKAVSLKTGAEIQVPSLLGGKHITAQLGPAPTKEVLESLLSSSQLDYILLGTDQSGKVSHIILREADTVSTSNVGTETANDPEVPQTSGIAPPTSEEREAESESLSQRLPKQPKSARPYQNSTTYTVTTQEKLK